MTYDQWRLDNAEPSDLVQCPICERHPPSANGYCLTCRGVCEIEKSLAQSLQRAARAENLDLLRE